MGEAGGPAAVELGITELLSHGTLFWNDIPQQNP
jgi:hypothetical protein